MCCAASFIFDGYIRDSEYSPPPGKVIGRARQELEDSLAIVAGSAEIACRRGFLPLAPRVQALWHDAGR